MKPSSNFALDVQIPGQIFGVPKADMTLCVWFKPKKIIRKYYI